jgi:hypothetical protein
MPRKIAIPNEENNEAKQNTEQSDNENQAVSVKEIIKEAITSYETEKKKNPYTVSKKRLQSLERARLIKEMNMKKEATDKIDEDKKQNEIIMKQKQLEEEKKINDLVEMRLKERQKIEQPKQEPPKPPQIKRKQHPRKKPEPQPQSQRQMTFFDQFKM